MAQIPVEDGYMIIPNEKGKSVRLVGSYSPEADESFFPRRRRCPITGGPVEDVEFSAVGTLYSWTFLHVPRMGLVPFAQDGGYGVGQVDLPEGPRIQAVIEGDMGDWEIGMKMRTKAYKIAEDKEGNELCGFCFEPEVES